MCSNLDQRLVSCRSFVTPQAEQAAARELGDETLVTKPLLLRTLDRQVTEHKDVNKALSQLVPVVSSLKADAGDILKGLSQFSALWKQVFSKICLSLSLSLALALSLSLSLSI